MEHYGFFDRILGKEPRHPGKNYMLPREDYTQHGKGGIKIEPSHKPSGGFGMLGMYIEREEICKIKLG